MHLGLQKIDPASKNYSDLKIRGDFVKFCKAIHKFPKVAALGSAT